MHLIHSIILGLVEGITEFLPVSSTAHLIIASRILHLADSEFLKSFEIVIQFGAILAVVVLYLKKILSSRTLWMRVLAGFVPTAVIGYVLYHFIKKFLIGNIVVVAAALVIGGIVLVIFELFETHKSRNNLSPNLVGKSLEEISFKDALVVGTIQSLAVIPGVSRSAATIVGGRMIGISRSAIVEFSFLLGVPVIAGAAVLDLVKTPIAFSGHEWLMLAVGTIVSFIVAILAIKTFLTFIKNHSFAAFGWYRIVLGILVFLLLR
ncbi:MAG: bacA [Patescibacteria group bacterium]|nr:bacA [Patescibacteria group bacterium]